MKNRGKINLILDLLMFLLMLAIFFVKGEFHETLAYTMGGLLILHIGLHWQQFTVMFRKFIPEMKVRYLVITLLAAAVVAILTMPLYLNLEGEGREGHHEPPPGYSDHRF